MPLRSPARAIVGALSCLVLLLGVALAQPSPPGGSESDNPNPEAGNGGTFSNLMEAIESGTKLLIRKMQPGEERDLVDNPRFNGQDSPRASVMTFTEAMSLVGRGYDEIGYRRALASLPPGSTRDDADRLYDVFLRLGPVSAATLPGEESIDDSGDSRFEFFPRATDHLWVWQELDEPPNGEITLERTDDGRWLFTAGTVAGLVLLQDSMVGLPPRFGENDGGAYFLKVFSPLVEETGLGGWIGFLGLTLFGVIAGVLIAKLVRFAAEKSQENNRGMVATTLKGLGAAFGVMVFTISFTIALGFLTLGPVLRPLRVEIPRFLLIVALTVLIVSIIDTIAAFAQRRTGSDEKGQFEEMVISAVRRIIRTVVLAIALLFVVQNVLGVNIGALFLGFGVVALALSLAAQDTVKNLFGAVTIYANRPFVVGDWIQFKGRMASHWGTVEEISLQAVKLRDITGNIVTIPNMQFIDREVQNLSAREFIRREVNIAIPYRPDAREADRAVEALMDVFTADEIAEDARIAGREGQPHVSFADFAEAWLTIRGYHYYYMGGEDEDVQRSTERSYFSWLDHCTKVNRAIVDTFGERNIEFAFPTQTIEMIRGDDRD